MIGRSWRAPIGLVLGVNAALGGNAAFTLLTIAAIGASVALATGLELTSRAIQARAQASAAALRGEAELEVVGAGLGVPEALLPRIAAASGVAAAEPIVAETVQCPAAGLALHIVGIDLTLLADSPGIESARERLEIRDPLRLLARPDAIVVTRTLAERAGLETGSELVVRRGAEQRTLRVEGIVAERGVARAFGGQVALMDVYALQALLGRGARFDRIAVRVEPARDVASVRAALERELGGAAGVQLANEGRSELEQTLVALRSAVWIVAALGSAVAALLSYAAMSTAVERRAPEFATLRSAGMSARGVASWICLDALGVATLGSALGLGAGTALAHLLLPSVARVAEWYEGPASDAASISLAAETFALALVVGLASAAAGAIAPARAATRRFALDTPGAERRSAGLRGARALRLALVIAPLAAMVFAARGLDVPPGARTVLVLGLGVAFAAALVPELLRALESARAALGRLLPGVGHLIGTGLGVRPRGTALAVVAIGALVAFVAGAITVSASFSATLLRDMRARDDGAVAISPEPLYAGGGQGGIVPDEVVAAIRATPGVAAVGQVFGSSLVYRGSEVAVRAFDTRVALARRSYDDPREAEIAAALGRGEVGVTRAFAQRFGVAAGDTIHLPTASGEQPFRVAGERRGFAGPTGILSFDLATFDRHWPRAGASAVWMFVDGDPAPVVEEVRRRTAALQPLFFTDEAALQEQTRAFARRFDALLVAVGALAALLGAFATANLLIALVAARRGELALLHVAGATRAQLAALVVADATVVALAGLASGALVGFALSFPMLDVLALDFGLPVDRHFDPGQALALAAAVLAAVALSAAYPAWLASRAADEARGAAG